VPRFVRDLIRLGWSAIRDDRPCFREIFERLEKKMFAILDGVDSAEVAAFANWVRAYSLD
jgi:hypothetical protein